MNAFSEENAAEFVHRYWPRQGDQPKHEKLCHAFTASILDGFWGAGARLPTEVELTSVTPCSLGTVQRALRRLVQDGLIERRRGSGTIVADLKHGVERPWHMRFFDDASPSEEPLPIYTRVLDRSVISQKGPWSRAINQKNQKAVRIDRIFSINRCLDIYSVFYTVSGRFPELTRLPLSALEGVNLKFMLAKHHVLPVHRVKQSMRIELPQRAVSEALGLKQNQPVTVLNVIAFSLNGEPVYYQDFYIPPNRYRLDLGMTMNSSS
jgi:GntR family transcriptional regulator